MLKTNSTIYLPDSAKPYYLTLPPTNQWRNFLIISKRTKSLFLEYNFWQKKSNTAIYYNQQNQAKVLKIITTNQPSKIFLSYEDYKQANLPPPSTYFKQILTLKVGGCFSQPFLIGKLLALGYQKEKVVSTGGQFNFQGGLCQIFSPDYDQTIRLDFFGDKIDQIKINQRDFNEIKIFPLKLNSGSNSLKDYLKINQLEKLILDEPVPEFMASLARPADLVIRPALKESDLISLPKFYHRNFNQLNSDLRKLSGDHRIYISTNQPSLIANKIKTLVTFLPFKLNGGFIHYKKLVVLSDQEIFGQTKKRERQKRFKYEPDLIASLRPGDYLVHIDHGVGIFSGMTKNVLASVTKEYFVINYQAGDKLYLPVDQADKITRYLGASKPEIHRLGSVGWLTVKRRVKADSEKLAQELLRLYAVRQTRPGIAFKARKNYEEKLKNSFPYTETSDQAKTINRVLTDMAKPKPMDRLICGDVGFGKTEVAIRASFRAALNHKQTAVLAPTTILSQQHYETFKQRLSRFKITISVLNRFRSKNEQKKIIEKLASGQIDIVIGTHRLLSSDVKFKNLGLLVIDEEQRFGVKHKEKLKKLKTNLDILTMSATPIPRTLNLSIAKLRDLSIIRTAPFGRLAVKTKILPYSEKIVARAIKRELAPGGQVYFLHNRVETIQTCAAKLKKLLTLTGLDSIKIDIAHGQMVEKELYQVMRDFNDRKVDILVCSSIIENGIDLPNVNTLIVDNSVYFGLSSLHQLRGRIGRSSRQAYAYFFYKTANLSDKAKTRLEILLKAKKLGDGMEIALADLELRGAGNILGRNQAGNINSVGLYLYNQLLRQTIKELRTGKKIKPKLDVKLDLSLSAFLPPAYISKETSRLKLYQKMANLYNKQIPSFKTYLKLNYGPIPPEVINLLKIIKLKNLASRVGINKILQVNIFNQKQIILEIAKDIASSKLTKLLDYNPNWIIKDKQIKIKQADLSNNWLVDLIKSLRKLI